MTVSKYASRTSTIAKKQNSDAILECVAEGCQTTSEIHARLVAKAVNISYKNIFHYLDFLRSIGKATTIGNARPARWTLATVDVEKALNPIEELSPDLAILMGYAVHTPNGAHTVSPLTQFEIGDYKTVPDNSRRPSFGIQSGLGNLNPLY